MRPTSANSSEFKNHQRTFSNPNLAAMSSRVDSEFYVNPGKIIRTNSIFTNNLKNKEAGLASANKKLFRDFDNFRAGSVVD